MHLYLTTYRGTGNILGKDDPFVPRGYEQPGASSLDLREDASQPGQCLVAVPVRDDTIGDYLGETPDGVKEDIWTSVRDVSVASKQTLQSKLDVSLQSTDVTSMVVELVAPKVRPTVEGLNEIWFAGGRFWKQPVLRGGSTFADTFVDSNGTLLSAHTPTGPNNGFAWVNGPGLGDGYDISGNAAGRHTGGLDLAIVDTDLTTLDEYAQITFTLDDTFGNWIAQGVCVRYRPDGTFGSGTVEWYRAQYFSITGGDWTTRKMSGGAETAIGTDTIGSPVVAGDVLRIEANGTTIRRLRNGVVQDTTTDSSIATYKRAAIFDSNGSGGAIARFSPFECGDLGATGYTLAASAGAFSIGGTAAALKYARVMPAAVGSYAISGTAAALKYARKFAVDPGAVLITGAAANLRYSAAAVGKRLARIIGG